MTRISSQSRQGLKLFPIVLLLGLMGAAALILSAHQALATPLPCIPEGKSTTSQVKNSQASSGVPDDLISADGKTVNQRSDTLHQVSLADKQRDEDLSTGELNLQLSLLPLNCRDRNSKQCDTTRAFVDQLAFRSLRNQPISCKYVNPLGAEFAPIFTKLVANPVKFLLPERFHCGQDGKELCCSDCNKTGKIEESLWYNK